MCMIRTLEVASRSPHSQHNRSPLPVQSNHVWKGALQTQMPHARVNHLQKTAHNILIITVHDIYICTTF